jgi:ADP-heptose:LPS heptosyltransferase
VVQSYDETAGFLANMDLVITVNTSLHHLAGALGVKQWCLCPKYIAWRYGIKGPSPWYGNCTMIRQEKPSEWGDVIANVVKRLGNGEMQKVAA